MGARGDAPSRRDADIMLAAVEAVAVDAINFGAVRVDTLALPADSRRIDVPGPVPLQAWRDVVLGSGWASGNAVAVARCLDEVPGGIVWEGTEVSEPCQNPDNFRFTLAVSIPRMNDDGTGHSVDIFGVGAGEWRHWRAEIPGEGGETTISLLGAQSHWRPSAGPTRKPQKD